MINKFRNIFYIIISIIALIYIFICIIYDISYVRYGNNIGWHSRSKAPLSYWTSVIFTPIIPFGFIYYMTKVHKTDI